MVPRNINNNIRSVYSLSVSLSFAGENQFGSSSKGLGVLIIIARDTYHSSGRKYKGHLDTTFNTKRNLYSRPEQHTYV